jgi:hypothetical protein
MADTPERFTLRQLPLPAKLVISVFLISVGAGYLAAMVQLHYKQASPGKLAPSLGDVVARFSGVPWPPVEGGNGHDVKPEAKANGAVPNLAAKDRKAVAAALPNVPAVKIKSLIDSRCARCHSPQGENDDVLLNTFAEISKILEPEPAQSQMLRVISSGDDSTHNKDNMSAVFTRKSEEDDKPWKEQIQDRPEAGLRRERETERLALVAWLHAGAPQEAYEADAFPLPKELAGQPLTQRFRTEIARAKADQPANGHGDHAAEAKRKAKSRQISVESLTQSTHAHLLSFAMLWALTGLTFAFTSYPLWARVTLAPIVLLAQLIDVACWWLARLPDVGPYFALAVIGTGAVVGVGLVLQIVLSLFNMYSGKGKAVLVLLFALAGGAAYLTFEKYIQPEVTAEAEAAQPPKMN